MIFRGSIAFFLLAKSDNARNNTLNKIKSCLQKTSGFNYSFKENEVVFEVDAESWAGLIYLLLRLSQSLGRQWIITGNIDFEFSAWTNNPAIVGVESISIVCDNLQHGCS